MLSGLTGCPTFDLGGPEVDDFEPLQWQDPPQGPMGWHEADAFCEQLQTGGRDDWRLPTIDELRTLIVDCPATMPGGTCRASSDCLDASCSDPQLSDSVCSCGPSEGSDAISGRCFHKTGFAGSCDCYTSSSPMTGNAPTADYHWEVCFDRAYVSSSPAATPQHVRCVRGGGGGQFSEGFDYGQPGGSPSGASTPARKRTYRGTESTTLAPATRAEAMRVPATMVASTSMPGNQRGTTQSGYFMPDSGGACSDGSAFVCSTSGCCGSSVTSTPSACCPTACCTNTTYCDVSTGGCGYTCQAGEIDCGDGTCCPGSSTCTGSGWCELEPMCPAGSVDCGLGSCCPSGTTCGGAGTCLAQEMCESFEIDCGDGFCCPNGSSCAGGGQCEEEGCQLGTQCGDVCCAAGDQCFGNGECGPPGCEDGEDDCGNGYCCPSGSLCNGDRCMPELTEEPEDEYPEPPVTGGGPGDPNCDTEDLLAALGGASSGNACVDACIQNALRCAGAAGCVLTPQCQQAETSCVMGCFPR